MSYITVSVEPGPGYAATQYGSKHELAGRVLVGVHGRPRLLIKNLGPGAASLTGVSITSDGRDLLGPVRLPIEIDAGHRVELSADNTVDEGGGARIHLTWRTADGEECSADRIHWRNQQPRAQQVP